MDLDPSTAIRILEPYPELLRYWRDEMAKPDREDEYGPGGIKQMHSPVYLREVVRQHRWVTEGPGDYIDPVAAERIEQILDTCPELRIERDKAVASPWVRAMQRDAYFATRWYTVPYVASRAEMILHPRPYDAPERQHCRDLSAAIRAGGEITITEMSTGRSTRLGSDRNRFLRPAD